MNYTNTKLFRTTVALVALAILVTTGCTSFRSTIVNRRSDDSVAPQCNARTSKGVPVKLKVPSHMEVKILETYFLATDTKANTKQMVAPRPNGERILNVSTKLIYTDKVFTVDFPRPLAGTLSLTSGSNKADGITFDSEQYFASIRGSYKEETLSTINDIFEGTAGESTSAVNFATSANENFTQLTRVVAFERFDINECGWEKMMHDFVERHLGCCNPPCGAVPIQYASSAGFDGQEDPVVDPVVQPVIAASD